MTILASTNQSNAGSTTKDRFITMTNGARESCCSAMDKNTKETLKMTWSMAEEFFTRLVDRGSLDSGRPISWLKSSSRKQMLRTVSIHISDFLLMLSLYTNIKPVNIRISRYLGQGFSRLWEFSFSGCILQLGSWSPWHRRDLPLPATQTHSDVLTDKESPLFLESWVRSPRVILQ